MIGTTMTTMDTNLKLGIDIGGVIIDRANDNTDTSFFSDNYLQTTEVHRATDSIAELVDMFWPENVFIVSKARLKTQVRSREWLTHQNFYAKTGVLPENVYFCLERADKAPIAEILGLTHFIDDKLDVLRHLQTVKYLYGFQVRPYELEKFQRDLLVHVQYAETWAETVSLIRWSLIREKTQAEALPVTP